MYFARYALAAVAVAGIAISAGTSPYGVTFDDTGFEWDAVSADNETSFNTPFPEMMKFFFEASSDAPCAEVKKALRVVSETGRALTRSVYMGMPRFYPRFSFNAPRGTVYSIIARALVRAPGDPGLGGAELWDVVDGPVVRRGVVE